MSQIANLAYKDTLDRRRRNAPRQPSDEPAKLNQTKLRLLEFIHLYGGFSTTDLVHEYALLEGIFYLKASTYTSKLLKEMYHDNGVLERPKKQRSVRYDRSELRSIDNPNRHNLVHQVSEKGMKVLESAGMFNDYAPKAHGWYQHQMMTACMYQMFYISARKAGIMFTSQHELKPKEKFILVPPALKIYPDAMFILHMDLPFLIFFELDRGTERGNDSSKRKTWGKSIEYYKEIFHRRLYAKTLDLPTDYRAFLLTVTSSGTMHKKIIDSIEAQYPKGCANMLVNTTRAFGPLPDDTFPPNPFDALDIRWARFGYPPVRLNKSK